jgi:hypothetical protein
MTIRLFRLPVPMLCRTCEYHMPCDFLAIRIDDRHVYCSDACMPKGT